MVKPKNAEELEELIEHALNPFVAELVKSFVGEAVNLEEASAESMFEIVCAKIEVSVREMVRELNQKIREGKYDEVREFIRKHPSVAQKAADHVAKNLRHSVRKMLREQLEQSKKDGTVAYRRRERK